MRGCRGGFYEKTSCWAELFPAGCETDLLLVEAEPASDVGTTSMITYFKNAGREDFKNVRGISLQTPRSMKKVEEELLQVLKQIFPRSLW